MAGASAASIIGGLSGNDTFFGGSGSNTITGGGRTNTYAFVKGSTGGTETITNFKAGSSPTLIGYGASEVVNTLASTTQTAGAPTLNTTNVSGF